MRNVPVLFSYIRPLRYFLLEGFQPVTSPSLPRLATHSNNSIFIRVEVNTTTTTATTTTAKCNLLYM